MTTRRGAPRTEAIGVEPVCRSVGAQPPDRSFAVLYLSGKDGILAQAVVDRGKSIAFREKTRWILAAFVASPEGATVDKDDEGNVRGRLRHVEIQLLLNVPVSNVREISVGNRPGRQRPILATCSASFAASYRLPAALSATAPLLLRAQGGHDE